MTELPSGSHTQLIVTFAGVAVCVFWMLGAYNRLVRMRNEIARAWAQVEVQLERRGQALSALLVALAEPMASEQGALESVGELQGQVEQASQAVKNRPAQAESMNELTLALSKFEPALTRLLSLLEHQARLLEHPEVEGPRNELLDVSARMPFARQLFNETVDTYNEATLQWPTRLLSWLYGFGLAGRL